MKMILVNHKATHTSAISTLTDTYVSEAGTRAVDASVDVNVDVGASRSERHKANKMLTQPQQRRRWNATTPHNSYAINNWLHMRRMLQPAA